MKVLIEIDETVKETEIIIKAQKMTDEVNGIMKRLSEQTPNLIMGFGKNTVEILDEAKLIRIYTSNGKVFAESEQGEYIVRLRLYELEQRLDQGAFVRISNSEIINLKKVTGFDLSFTGTICVKLENGKSTYVSRRYVSKIKRILGI